MQLFPERSLRGVGYALGRISVLVYLLFGIILYVRQDAYIFVPPSGVMGECAELPDAEIVSMEGTRAYYLPSGTSSKIAIMYHGNGENSCDSAVLMRWISAKGFNVLNVEYAGYSGDTSEPSVALLLHDVEHANKWVRAKNFSELLIIGRSVGTGFASYHASLAAPDRLLLISPFDSLARVAQGHFPVYPASLMLKTDLGGVPGASKAKRVLVIHGTDDVIVPMSRGKSLYTQLPQKEKIFITATGYGHNDVLDAPEAQAAIDEFLK